MNLINPNIVKHWMSVTKQIQLDIEKSCKQIAESAKNVNLSGDK